MDKPDPGVYVSVDVETAGPSPAEYPMLAIGACLVHDPDAAFYVELKPDKERIQASAIDVSGLDPAQLQQDGTPPKQAMIAFERWLDEHTPEGVQPIFVAFNAAFDWMFVADYFHRYLGRNPFGHRALDIKALYMGMFAVPWEKTGMTEVGRALGLTIQLSHNALTDARDQARLFNTMLQRSKINSKDEGTT